MAWEYLDLVRVYTKPKGKLPDFNEPVVLHRGRCSVEDFVNKVGGRGGRARGVLMGHPPGMLLGRGLSLLLCNKKSGIPMDSGGNAL